MAPAKAGLIPMILSTTVTYIPIYDPISVTKEFVVILSGF
jgi:hypothetical protein